MAAPVCFFVCKKNTKRYGPGLVFTKGLRLSQVLGLNPVLKLRLLAQLSFVLKPYSQRVTGPWDDKYHCTSRSRNF